MGIRVSESEFQEWVRKGLIEPIAEVKQPTSKYKNQKIEANGVTFDSKGEYRRWLELFAMQAAGRISELQRQVRFDLHSLGGAKICSYVADFVYIENGRRIVEDYKSEFTAKMPMFKIKAKWMKAEHGIEIRLSGRKPN